jgi:hypothetical protein
MFLPNTYKISDYVYLSGIEGALNNKWHEHLDFGLVINCSNQVPFLHPRRTRTKYLKFPIEDNLKNQIM